MHFRHNELIIVRGAGLDFTQSLLLGTSLGTISNSDLVGAPGLFQVNNGQDLGRGLRHGLYLEVTENHIATDKGSGSVGCVWVPFKAP